jgi:hypothetical protein
MTAEHTPLVTALLACEIADVGFDPASFAAEGDPPQFGFLLESELAPGLTLSIEHREAKPGFIIRSDSEVSAGRLDDAMRIALQLNHVAADTDLFSVDPVSSAIVFSRRLYADQVDLHELAFAVRTATEVGLSLARCEVPGILLNAAQDAVSEFTSDISILRG